MQFQSAGKCAQAKLPHVSTIAQTHLHSLQTRLHKTIFTSKIVQTLTFHKHHCINRSLFPQASLYKPINITIKIATSSFNKKIIHNQAHLSHVTSNKFDYHKLIFRFRYSPGAWRKASFDGSPAASSSNDVRSCCSPVASDLHGYTIPYKPAACRITIACPS